MLKGIPAILSPELLKILMEMGHGDEIVIGDGNFPAQNYGRRVVRLDGHGVPEILDAILQLFPLDTFVECPVAMMEQGKGDPRPEIWAKYEEIIQSREPVGKIEYMERFAFYDRSKQAYAIVGTGEQAVYANVILKKGVVR